MLKSCAQPVYGLGVRRTKLVTLSATYNYSATSPVYVGPTYTGYKPTFVLGLVHYFFSQLVSVRAKVVHLIHRTNKDNNKFKVKNNS